MMKTSWAEATLNNLKSAANAANNVRERDANVLVGDLEVPLRSIVVAEDFHRSEKLDTGSVGRHEDDSLLRVLGCGGVRLAHHQVDGVPWVTSA